jgi:membrane carboxypeptidase/penicillin-binding protein PbpC
MKNKIYIILWFLMIFIWIAFFLFTIILKPIFYEASLNLKEINNWVITTVNNYKNNWNYEIDNYSDISYTPVYTKNWELYAKLVPKNYYSKTEYNINSSEIISLLYIEDKGFLFRNLTFSIKWFLRSLHSIHFKWIKQWWSWITQQLVKNTIINDNKSTLSRKYKELIVSYYIDNNFSKIDILNSYLNKISYWKNIYWIQRAWELYLWKEILRLEDTFLLNSLLKQPTYFYKNQDKLKERAKYYLWLYLKDNWINKERINLSYEYIDSLKLEFKNHNQLIGQNSYIKDKAEIYVKNKWVWEIHLNYDISIEKEKEINDKIKLEEKRICELYKVCDIWIVVMSNSWTINYLYWWNYDVLQVDSTSSSFELGSTLKPFIYAKYFDQYWKKLYLSNSKICIWDYCPKNWDNSYSSSVSFSKAINLSYNLPIIHIAKNYLRLVDINELFINLWLYKKNTEENLNFSMILWTKQSSLIKLTNTYYSLFEWYYKNITLLWEPNKETYIFNNENIKYIRNILTKNWLNNKYSIKTWTSSEFKDHYLIAINNNYIIWVWMWNKDWTKTKKDIYSITKWKWIFKILSKYY